MKISTIVGSLFLLASAEAFAPVVMRTKKVLTRVDMFAGGGENAPKEDDAAGNAQLEQQAKMLGLTREELLAVQKGWANLEVDKGAARVSGESGGVTIEGDGRIGTYVDHAAVVDGKREMMPNHMTITITDDAKAKGKEDLSKAITEAFKSATEASSKKRKDLMEKMMMGLAELDKKK
eukprot:CAMPEP_0116846298 /NCGR_PEP_ID=MMETSP0418-20121206/13754_1 /TAXON_ID=1158023 /ORGANISM="Astrosyne radiata, Strain 13vi08-1A" /LENGTH=177 /DNA_ID=CAMNT_0004477523 /DNA_START=23 /DNA_END=556 /DNA_ORIENTATION=+